MKNRLGKALKTSLITCSMALMSAVGTAQADTISDFNNSWAGKAMALQRLLDVRTPMADNNILGTHNTYNSEVYRACNFSVGCRYLDPQQKYSIKDQLRMGARFIEIDVHYTAKMESLFSYPKRLLMCHGVCSLNDKYLHEGLNEIKDWLNSSESNNQVLILYIEDHMDGRHQDAYNDINSRFGHLIYRSGGCQSIPNTLTKSQVLAAGKKVVLWGDGGCRSNNDWKTTAFTGLGDIGRIWEDRTTLGTIANVVDGGSTNYIEPGDVTRFFKEGANIVNLDDMVTNDGRLEATVWSWGANEPNNSNNEDCAHMRWDGRWNDNQCSNYYRHACKNTSNGSWALSTYTGQWTEGHNACQALGSQYQFAVPTNSKDNQALNAVRAAANEGNVWMNHDDLTSEGVWYANGQNPLAH